MNERTNNQPGTPEHPDSTEGRYFLACDREPCEGYGRVHHRIDDDGAMRHRRVIASVAQTPGDAESPLLWEVRIEATDRAGVEVFEPQPWRLVLQVGKTVLDLDDQDAPFVRAVVAGATMASDYTRAELADSLATARDSVADLEAAVGTPIGGRS
ncbi:hypothetical protein K8W59_09020 [Nocardioides rotundus]|uniref:hypothetical protein n=1 Tax=Nocardioides rotundus TaxID=1774216 RepID=UPI001CBE4CCE|nr:hypothetical protein [Nocardioides rotundus]UAL31554.1 hypothetical protein K8W59_09020 [Nocardioides rotundus]